MEYIPQMMCNYFTIRNFGVNPLEPVQFKSDYKAKNILKQDTRKLSYQYKTFLETRGI